MSGEKTMADMIMSGLQVANAKLQARIKELEGERDEARAVAGYPTELKRAVPFCSDEIEALQAKWPRVVEIMFSAERETEAAVARAEIAESQLSALQASVRLKDEALRPFAKEFAARAHLSPGPDIDDWPIHGNGLTLGDLRRASQALGGGDG